VNRPWIDAHRGINGVRSVFPSRCGSVLRITLAKWNWAILERRMSCNLLAHEDVAEGKVPTTPTISSIIAGIRCRKP